MMDGILADLDKIASRKDMAMRGLKAEEVFGALDKDGDNFVTRAEIDVLAHTDVYQFIEELFVASDSGGVTGSTAGDDTLTREEWMKGIIFHTHYKTDREFMRLFDEILELLRR